MAKGLLAMSYIQADMPTTMRKLPSYSGFLASNPSSQSLSERCNNALRSDISLIIFLLLAVLLLVRFALAVFMRHALLPEHGKVVSRLKTASAGRTLLVGQAAYAATPTLRGCGAPPYLSRPISY